jgi:hypothetical protein
MLGCSMSSWKALPGGLPTNAAADGSSGESQEATLISLVYTRILSMLVAVGMQLVCRRQWQQQDCASANPTGGWSLPHSTESGVAVFEDNCDA